ncbi:MAG: transpeptidase family protein [Flavobacteriales bacterium]|nr:transpeptidase family protein [Flavobacteriales bacterium]
MSKSKTIKRTYFVYILLVIFGLTIFSRIVVIQFVEGEHWEKLANSHTLAQRKIEAVRGNIYAADGSLLATSIPRYEVRFDCNAEAITDKLFKEQIDTLALCLSRLLPEKSKTQWKQQLTVARNNGERYHLIKRNLSFTELKELREFPIFSRGQYKGGFIYIQNNKREKPFQMLASRTIGYHRDATNKVGLEGAYDQVLSGVSGMRLMKKIAGGIWMPVSDDNEIEPEDGSDIITTIDINIQDVAESALLEQLKLQDADHGCVVLMEVKTGEIKAIANLTRTPSGRYWETYNYAVGESTEPGSTFKLASLIAAIEDGYIDLDDSIRTGKGVYKFYDQKMYDSHAEGFGTITVQRAFEVSSNIAVAKIINDNYEAHPQKFIDRLYKMNLNQKLGLQIFGEGTPQIKSASDPTWSGISLPWISHGYEVALTPLQILTFYNGVANDGKLIKPRFVREIKKMGKTVKTIEPQIINPAICSQNTIKKAKKMLEGVVENGTARNLKNPNYKIGGKTGTAQIYNAKYGYKYETNVSYQASFVGYFPADDPMYSCIVVVNAPSKNVYYGNLVAGPIFKEIADKVYATSVQIHDELTNQQLASGQTKIPVSSNGSKKDLTTVFAQIGVPTNSKSDETTWVATQTGAKSVTLHRRIIRDSEIPNVVGMDLKDAIFILENLGINVEFEGSGTIKEQYPASGTPITNIETVKIKLA